VEGKRSESTHHAILLNQVEHRPMIAEQFPDWPGRMEWWDVADPHAAMSEEGSPDFIISD
jgi:hypothetical protein